LRVRAGKGLKTLRDLDLPLLPGMVNATHDALVPIFDAYMGLGAPERTAPA
jgi:hypothetical protein